MASKIRIHRSTGASAPSSLEFGELAATVEQGTAGTSANKAGRVFIGNVGGNPVEIGGEYTYKLLDHTPGQTHPVSALITDSNGNIDGIKIAGISTITRTDITDTVTENLRVTGVTTFVQGITVTGNMTIGDAHTDTLTINSRTGVSTDLTFNNRFKVAGISTFNGTVDVNGTVDFGADIVFNSATNDITFDQSASKFIFKDNNKATFGTSDDLQIYHSGSHSYIKESGDGDLRVPTSKLDIRNAADNASQAVFTDGAGVELFFAGNKKAFTTATGFNVTDTNMVLTSTHNAPTHTVGTGATFTTSFHLGSGGTNVKFPVARGANDQILISDANGNLAFEDVPGTLVISAGYAATDAVQLLPDVLTIAATTNETKTTLTDNKITVGLATDVRVGGGLTVANNCHIIGNLTVDGTETVLNTIRLDVQDNKVGVGSTSTASNTTANGCGYFVHGGAGGDKEILYLHSKTAFTVNQHWLPVADDTHDLGSSTNEWKDLYIDGTAYIDTLSLGGGGSIGNDMRFVGANYDVLWDHSADTMRWEDGAKATFGTNDDLAIYHDSSGSGHSYIADTGTGNLNIRSSNLMNFQNAGGTKNYAIFTDGGAVQLFHNHSDKFQTTATGTNVTGVHVDDGATHDGDVTFTGASANVLWDKSADDLIFNDGAKAIFGTGSDGIEIYHASGNSYIADTGTGSLRVGYSGVTEVYHGTSKMLESTAYGINVTGTTESDTLLVTGVSTVASMIFSAGTQTNGVAFFDANGQVTSTINPSNSVTTSFKILTTTSAGVPTWTSTIDCGTF